jgi:RNA polymerase sigma factor (sigma-70 family)
VERIELRRLLDRLGSDDPKQAWRDLLQEFAGLILETVRFCERNSDHVSDCFLFCCEQLYDRSFRRLRAFRPDGAASFETWLRAVVRNLCVDWRRQEFGRLRLFDSVARLGMAEQRAFEYLYSRQFPIEHATALLRADFPRLDAQQIEAVIERLHRALTERQLWLLSTRQPEVLSLEGGPGDVSLEEVVASRDPGPEAEFRNREILGLLGKAVSALPASDRLLLQLRYEQDLTLAEIALLANLKDAFAVDRRLRAILARLRSEFPARSAKSTDSRPCNADVEAATGRQ